MKLTPYRSKEQRYFKVLKHVFLSHSERWWDLLDGLDRWHADQTALRVARCLSDPDASQRAVEVEQPREVLDRNHAGWLAVAERACDEARDGQRVYPGKSPRQGIYIGKAGVQVVVANESILVTCFRPGHHSSRVSDTQRTRAADIKARLRSGVRRQSRHTSVWANATPQHEDKA